MSSVSNHEWISHCKSSSVVKLYDGLTYRVNDLQTDVPSPFGLFRTLIYGRVLSSTRSDGCEDFIEHNKLSQNYMLFVVTGDVNISKDIYNINIPKYPVTVDSKLVSFRKSSYILETSLSLRDIHNPVASIRTNIVCVDKETRKPIPLPDWWTENFKGFSDKSPTQHFKYFVSPEKPCCRGVPSHPYKFPVPRRDQDGYQHVHTACYLQYCLDALEFHLCSNKNDCDIHTVSLFLKRAQFAHRGESQMGDILAVAFWDDETNPDEVYFDITKCGQSIYQARMMFYSEISGKQSKL